MNFPLAEQPHRRYNPLTDSWVLVSPHRNKRPWQGQEEKGDTAKRPIYDETCYLCPGNKRSNGEFNPNYESAYSFVNDFSALKPSVEKITFEKEGLLRAESEGGICKVVCFSPRHDLSIPDMEASEVRAVVDLWVKEYQDLGSLDHIEYVQIFENKGAVMGCSNPHPHGQIWASSFVPDEPLKKQANQLLYLKKHQKTLLFDYLLTEIQEKVRMVFENDDFVVLVPFWAVWPFETMIVPKRPMANIAMMSHKERDSFAHAYKQLTMAYDQLFEVSFPYSAGIHQAPTDGFLHEEWHWHMVFLPPLLRSATVKKFMVGYEMLANPQRDITPEQAAERLRVCVSKVSGL